MELNRRPKEVLIVINIYLFLILIMPIRLAIALVIIDIICGTCNVWYSLSKDRDVFVTKHRDILLIPGVDIYFFFLGLFKHIFYFE